MQPDTPDNNDHAANPLDTTEAEAAALKTQEAPPAAEQPPAGEAAPQGDAPATAAAKPTDPPAAGGDDAAAAAAADAPAAASPPQSPAQPTPFAPVYMPTGDQRDYAKDLDGISSSLKDLKQKLASDDIDEDAYDLEYERLQDQKTKLVAAQAVAEARAEMSQQNADQAWAYLQNQFFAMPENAAIRGSTPMFAAWEAAMQDVVNLAHTEKRAITDWEIMVGARQKLIEYGFPLQGANTQPQQPQQAQALQAQPPKPDRTPPIGQVPQQLSTAPNTGDPGARPTAETIAGMGIEDIETRMGAMSDDQRDAILRGTPGAFVD